MNIEREAPFLEFFTYQEDLKKGIDSSVFGRSHNRDHNEYGLLGFQVLLQVLLQMLGVHTSGRGDADADDIIYADPGDG